MGGGTGAAGASVRAGVAGTGPASDSQRINPISLFSFELFYFNSSLPKLIVSGVYELGVNMPDGTWGPQRHFSEAQLLARFYGIST